MLVWLFKSLKGMELFKKTQGEKLASEPSMCDSGLPLQVLALDSTRTSEDTQPSDLLNFLALQSVAPHWFEMPVHVHSFPFSVLSKQVSFKLKGVYRGICSKGAKKKKNNNVSESLSKFSNGLLSQWVKITGHLEWICLWGTDKLQLAFLRLSTTIVRRRCLKDMLLE